MASLFGRSALAERAQQIDTDEVREHIALLQVWLDDYETGSLKADKETSREQQYNADIFGTILGYKSKPANPYTFEPKDTTEKKQYPDAVLRYTDSNDAAANSIFAVVELKGAAINLDKPQQREGNLSPVQQAFKYKPQYRSCPFVIVSNFYEFRLYNDNQLDYESWTLRQLVDPADDYLNFKKWYVLLHVDNMTAPRGKSNTEKLLSDIRQKQLDVGKDFYAKYSSVRTALLQDVWRKNPKTRLRFATAIQKVQTIIDRVMFACFAEDGGLLPDDTLQRVIKSAENSAYSESLWDELKLFFTMVDKGSRKLGIPDGYNGGLFAEDPLLDSLDISDEPLRKLLDLGKYDFKEDLRVNILGHVFEQSITDIEEIKRRVQNEQKPFDPQADLEEFSRRKKEGIYYTPDYIVRYIVNATLGVYLAEQEARIQKKHNLSGMRTEVGYETRERIAYTEYQHVLQTIKVLDPACGSGAFLVHVFDYLLAENKRVDAILGGGLYSTDDYVRSILSDNIFGVDLNEESVEITKLSLWLKTASKGKKLTELDKNIRCGNSLIADPSLADRSFDWQREFPEIFAPKRERSTRSPGDLHEPGFHVIVGNPPYVQLSQGGGISDELREYLVNRYGTSGGRLNTFIFFTLLALDLLKPEGRLGFIIPNTILTQEYYKGARKVLLERSSIDEIVEYPEMQFEDAVVENISLILTNRPIESGRKPVPFDVVSQTSESVTVLRSIDQRPFVKAKNHVFSLRGDLVTDAIDGLKKTTTIDKHYNVNQAIALKGDRKASIKDAPEPDGEYYKLLDGRNISRYQVNWSGNWLEYDVSRIHSCKRKDIFQADEKIFFRRTGVSIIAAYDDQQYFALNTLVVITPKVDDSPLTLKALTVLMNSAVLNHYYGRKYKSTKTVFSEIQARTIGALPLPGDIGDYDAQLTKLADEIMATLKSESSTIQSCVKYLSATYGVDPTVVSGAIDKSDWKPLEKALTPSTTIVQRREVFEYFEEVLAGMRTSGKSYKTLVSRADDIIAKAYGLTPELARMTATTE